MITQRVALHLHRRRHQPRLRRPDLIVDCNLGGNLESGQAHLLQLACNGRQQRPLLRLPAHRRPALFGLRDDDDAVVLVRACKDAAGGDTRDLLQGRLHLAERDVLSALQLDEVLLAVDDAQHAVGVDDADIARVEVLAPVGVHREVLHRFLLHLVVPDLRHVVPRNQDLAARRVVRHEVAHVWHRFELNFRSGLDRTNTAAIPVLRPAVHRKAFLHCRARSSLRGAIALCDGCKQRLHKLLRIFGQRRSPRDEQAHPIKTDRQTDLLDDCVIQTRANPTPCWLPHPASDRARQELAFETNRHLPLETSCDRVKHRRHCCHESGTEGIQVWHISWTRHLVVGLDVRAGCRQRARVSISQAPSLREDDYLHEELEDVRKRKVRNDNVLGSR
mmetsp:Transcript_68010/g.141817  ORF Transcript_68010/g.141817 Transcript_68010/m.141817 type:complete len:390 (+) Transcript_68010:195-1364(+)